jgi:cystathionine beta-lyase/cystathionine gamma-synthase
MDLDYSQLGFGTALAHLGEEAPVKGAVAPPIFQTSTFVFETMEELWNAMIEQPDGPDHHYSRISNPTTELAEKKIAHLEGTEACKLFGTGMGAISAGILTCVESGSHVIASDTCYGPARDFISKYLSRFGVTHTFVDGRCPEEYFDAIRPETTLIYMESPSSLIFRMQDVAAICKIAKEKGITTMLDNTYSTPIHFQPASVGVDLVVHSGTKYMGGHSDLTAGIICCTRERALAIVRNEIAYFGATMSSVPAWLLIRGLRTLPLRMKRAESTGNTVAAWIDDREEIDVVHHVGLPTYPQRDLVRQLLKGSGGLFSFEPKAQNREQVHAFCNALKLFGKGISWGGHESLVVASEVQPSGYSTPRWLVRLYCGLEEPQDLIADLEAALPLLTPR